MKSIQLSYLNIHNFKGCKALTLNFAGRSATISGKNGTGKTTIYDAFSWLLYNKDSTGASNFGIKPWASDGQIADHAAVSSVEAGLSINGVEMILRKDFYERWSTRRGSDTETFDGNTTEYFIDGVPLKKHEYDKRIADMCEEDTFRLLTNVAWFCEGLDWRKRRDMLFQICDLHTDKAIMASDPKFADLATAMGALSLDDYKRKLTARRKSLNADRGSIPARLDEQQKIVESLAGIDFAVTRSERDSAAAKMQSLQEELLRLSHGSQLEAKRNELAAAKNALTAEINDNNSYRQSQMIPVADRRPELRAAIDKAKADFIRWTDMAKKEADLISQCDFQIQNCRKLWAAADAMEFSAESCPTCGQTLPAAAQKAAKERFESRKAQDKADAVSRADSHKATKATAEYRREQAIEAAVLAENEIARLNAELEAYVPDTQPEVSDLPGHDKRMAALDDKIFRLQAELDDLAGETATIRSAVDGNIKELRSVIAGLDTELAKESVLQFAAERCEELRETAKKVASELGALDKQLFLCEEYARYKVRFVETAANGKFKLARWKLFDEQINGGITDCCEAMYNGVPYNDGLNYGMKFNLGIDVIRTFSEHFGVRVPLFIDNSESVSDLIDAGTQVIQLAVSKFDEELRIVYEA